MTCREFRETLRRPGRDEPGPEMLRHAETCQGCAAEARGALLLRLGSGGGEDAAPRPGFEERLKARLASGPAATTTSAWNGGFERLVRPALALAATLTVLCAGFYIGVALPEPGGDLASLVETDAVFTSLLAGDPGEIFPASPDPRATVETP
jgi:hypothetical protein